MCATWRGRGGEERWVKVPPRGGQRGVSARGSAELFNGNGWGRSFSEAMSLTRDQTGVVMRLRHFDPGMTHAWEDRDAPMSFRLTHLHGTEAIFDGEGPHRRERLTYRRTGDSLTVIGDFIHHGKRRRERFDFRRSTR